MSGTPSLIASYARVIELQRGLRAQVAGNDFDIYRINGSSSGEVDQPANLVYADFPMIPERTSATNDVEANWSLKVPLFNGVCDPIAVPLAVGDLLIEAGPRAEIGNAFTFAGYRAGHISFFVQTLVEVTFWRTNNNTEDVDGGRAPYEGWMPGAGATANVDVTDQPLVLASGEYSWDASGSTASPVYVGLAQQERVGHYPSPDVKAPDDIQLENWHLYVPPAVAPLILENDVAEIVNQGDRIRYRIRAVYAQANGLHGGMFLAEKAWP